MLIGIIINLYFNSSQKFTSRLRNTLLISTIILSHQANITATPIMKLSIGETILQAEIANTKATKKTGLMYRKNLPKDYAMLFIFKKPKVLSFWMKNTSIPLSIAFINSQGIITQIETLQPLSLTNIVSKEKSTFALEVNQGFFKKHNIQIGDEINFDKN